MTETGPGNVGIDASDAIEVLDARFAADASDVLDADDVTDARLKQLQAQLFGDEAGLVEAEARRLLDDLGGRLGLVAEDGAEPALATPNPTVDLNHHDFVRYGKAASILVRRLYETGRYVDVVVEARQFLETIDAADPVDRVASGDAVSGDGAAISASRIEMLHNLGASLQMVGRPGAALEHLQRSLILAMQHSPDHVVRSIVNLGVCYGRMGQTARSNELFEEAIEIYRIDADPDAAAGLMAAYSNIVVNCLADDEIDEGLAAARQSAEVLANAGEVTPEVADQMAATAAYLYLNLGHLWFAKSAYEVSRGYFQQAIDSGRTVDDLLVACHGTMGIGDTLLAEHDYERAIEHLSSAHEMARELASQDELAKCCERLATGYAKIGEFEKALDHHRRFHEHYAKVFNDEMKASVSALEVQHEIDKADLRAAMLKRDNELLTTAYEEQAEILRVVSHDVRNPLSVLSGGAELLQEMIDERSDPLVRQIADRMLHAVGYADQIVGQLMQLAQEEGDPETKSRLANVALRAAVNAALDRRAHPIERKSIAVSLEVDGDVHVVADETVLAQMLDNLVSNAIKFSYGGGSVVVRSERVADSVRLEVIDEGVGIVPEEAEMLFTKFGRLPSSAPTDDETSTGLGLYLTKRHAKRFGGTVELESNGSGQGATASLTLPTAQPASGTPELGP